MQRYNLLSADFASQREGIGGRVKGWLISALRRRAERQARSDDTVDPVPVDRDPDSGERQSLSDDQVETLVYYLVRDFIRYDRIDGLKHDVNIEDISCDGYNEPVFVHHTNYGQLLTNITFGEDELDEFVIELAQRARKGISKRQPNVDATLEDGSRAQLTLGREVSDRGTNFTIRQFKEVPFTPVDLVSWETYSLSQMVYLWLAIESGKSMVIAGGTASGKTTTLNALSLFIPSDTKLVSIEDTRELLMPQRNWVPTTTREAFRADDGSAIDEFELLEDALRKRPDYIIMGEVRGEEGRTLFQAMNTGHTVCTTFHAKSPKEVIRRFTEEPISVASSMFGAVDIVVNQESTAVDGQQVRRSTGVVEIDEYDAQAEEFVVDRTYDWDSVTDEIRPTRRPPQT
jgi:Type IV secretory pathway, VirB11 components, and related ATPases involved in archaeal flagella biosynthesis